MERLLWLNSGGIGPNRRDVAVYWDPGRFEVRAAAPGWPDWWMRTNSATAALDKVREIVELCPGPWVDWTDPV